MGTILSLLVFVDQILIKIFCPILSVLIYAPPIEVYHVFDFVFPYFKLWLLYKEKNREVCLATIGVAQSKTL